MRPVLYSTQWSNSAVRSLMRDAGDQLENLLLANLPAQGQEVAEIPFWHQPPGSAGLGGGLLDFSRDGGLGGALGVGAAMAVLAVSHLSVGAEAVVLNVTSTGSTVRS